MVQETLTDKEAYIPPKETNLEIATRYHQDFLLKSSASDLINAINAYIEAINENPKEASAYYRLAVLMYENKQIGIESAIEQCRQAVYLAPNNPDARMYLGYFLSIKGEKEDAKRELKKAIKLSPKGQSRAKFIMALELLDKDGATEKFKSFAKGMYYIIQASMTSLFDKAAIKMLAKNLLTDLNYLKYSTFGKLLENFKMDKDAYQVYSDALDNTKNAPEFYEKMAKIAIKKQRPNVAMQCFENATKLSGNNPQKLVNVIEFLQDTYPEKIDELIEYYNMLVVKLPEFSRPYYELGHLYLKKEDYIDAANAFRMALENDKENPFYLNSLAFAYVQLEQYNTAVELYKKAIEKNPDNEWTAVVAQALAAIYYKIHNNYEGALQVLEHALDLTKEKAPIHALIADIYFDDNNMERAVKYYNTALLDGLKDPKIYSRLAMAYWEQNLIEDAINSYKLAIKEDVNYDIAHNNLGVIYLDSLKDLTKALECFKKAIELNSNYTLAHFNLGRCYQKLNKKIESATEYQKAIDLNRMYPEIDEEIIQEKLYKLFEA